MRDAEDHPLQAHHIQQVQHHPVAVRMWQDGYGEPGEQPSQNHHSNSQTHETLGDRHPIQSRFQGLNFTFQPYLSGFTSRQKTIILWLPFNIPNFGTGFRFTGVIRVGDKALPNRLTIFHYRKRWDWWIHWTMVRRWKSIWYLHPIWSELCVIASISILRTKCGCSNL